MLCLDHYIEQAHGRLQSALTQCQQCQPVEQRGLTWLLADADFALRLISQADQPKTYTQREKLLELLLGLANLQEYLRHHSVPVEAAE